MIYSQAEDEMPGDKDVFNKIEWVIFRIALLALALIGIIKLLKSELMSLW